MLLPISFPATQPWLSSEDTSVLGVPNKRSLAAGLCWLPPLMGIESWGGLSSPAPLGAAHPPAVDAEGDAVIGLVAANLTDELQDGVNG